MRNANCPLCGDSFKTGPGYLVQGHRKYPGRRGWWPTRFLLCSGCYGFGYDSETGMLRDDHMRELDGARWTRVVGRGDEMPPTPCASCGRPFIRNADPLLKRPTCSDTCSTDLTRSRNGNQGPGGPCEVCAAPITTGRADSRTCSSACRQKAYRQRKAHA